jgi:hypothetical protein
VSPPHICILASLFVGKKIWIMLYESQIMKYLQTMVSEQRISKNARFQYNSFRHSLTPFSKLVKYLIFFFSKVCNNTFNTRKIRLMHGLFLSLLGGYLS